MNFKQRSAILRIPIGKQIQLIQNRKPIMSKKNFELLLLLPVSVEEKLDGKTGFRETEDYVIYYEDLKYLHSVPYSKVPPPLKKNAAAFRICFDIWLKDDKRWANREELEILCAELGYPVSPLIFEGIVKKTDIRELSRQCSFFGEEQMEGIVIKNREKNLFGKFINREFIEGLLDEDFKDVNKRTFIPNKIYEKYPVNKLFKHVEIY